MIKPRPLKRKDGTIYAYQLRVYRGKGVKDYQKTIRIPEGMKSTRQVQAWLNREQAQFENDCAAGFAPTKSETFEQYADYVMEVKASTLKARSFERDAELLNRLRPEIGFMKLEDITPEILNRLYLRLAEPGQNRNTGGGLSPKTIREYHVFIHMVYAKALKEGRVHYNVADRATPPTARKTEAEGYEPEMIEKVIEALKTEPLRWQCVVHLMIATGMRRGEVMGLKWENIDFETGVVKVCVNLLYHPRRGVYEDTPKNGKTRFVGIPAEVLTLLRQHRKEQDLLRFKMGMNWTDTGFCFTNEKGEPLNPDEATKWLGRFSKKHGLPHLHPHGFRHTQASVLIAEGTDPVAVSKRLGHAQVSTTMNIYAHQLARADVQVTDTVTNVFYNHRKKEEEKQA